MYMLEDVVCKTNISLVRVILLLKFNFSGTICKFDKIKAKGLI